MLNKKDYSKISLEVPGNAPDARHIYENEALSLPEKFLVIQAIFGGGLTDEWNT